MAAFCVGQRVRVVADFDNDGSGPPVGLEGVVTGGLDEWRCLDGTQLLGYEVSEKYICRASELEPVLPEGAAPSEFTTLADLLTSLNAEVPA